MRLLATRSLLLVSLLAIAAATLTPTAGTVGGRAVVWCLTCTPQYLADAVSNVVLFVPLGLALVLCGVRVPVATTVGAMLSLGIEALQHAGFPAGRIPALSDFLTNTLGALTGALVAAHWRALVLPGVTAARRLAVLWAVLAAMALAGSEWLLTPVDTVVGATTRVEPSPLPFTPGFGWYDAYASDTRVNGVMLRHRGTGPVIAQAARTDSVVIDVTVRGRDERRSAIPVVYVHAPGMLHAHTMLAQRGDDAVMRVALRARRYGLNTPELALHDVFADGARADSSALVLRAVVHGRRLALSVEGVAGPGLEASLVLSPLIGWTLLQSAVRVDAALAPLVTIAWVCWWLLPLAWWGWRGRP